MGACFCKGHKGLQSAPESQLCADGKPVSKEPANGILSDKKICGSNYNIGELATSSLLGLVATIKEHITKPTAMAQGRVAHLIEWKALGGGGGTIQQGAGWDRVRGGWAGAGAGLQEDEQLYSDLTDETKEARFAAGVAQQFAIAEAALTAWSSQDITDGSNSSSVLLKDPDSIFLSQYLLSSSGVGSAQHCYGNEMGSLFPPQLQHSQCPSTGWQPKVEHPVETSKTSQPSSSIRHADSCSLSEDEVFYD